MQHRTMESRDQPQSVQAPRLTLSRLQKGMALSQLPGTLLEPLRRNGEKLTRTVSLGYLVRSRLISI